MRALEVLAAAVRALDPFRSKLSDYARFARSEYAEKRRAPAPAAAGAAREARAKSWALSFARRARTPA